MISPLKIANIFKVHKDWLDYEPMALWVALRDEVRNMGKKDLDEKYKNMVLAVRACMGTERPYREWDIFENTALALNEEIPITDEMQEIFTPEVALAVKVMNELNPEAEWSDEVKAYIAVVAKKDGYIAMPKELLMSQGVLDGITKSTGLMRDNIRRRYAEWNLSNNKKPDVDEDDYISVGAAGLKKVDRYIKEKLEGDV